MGSFIVTVAADEAGGLTTKRIGTWKQDICLTDESSKREVRVYLLDSTLRGLFIIELPISS